ncbi:unnamed protein product [Brassica oleracea]
MKPPLKSHETRETPIREVYDTTTIPELLQLIDSILEELHRSLGITSVEANQSEKNQTSTDGPDPTDTKRLSEPFFLKNILLENSSGDTSDFWMHYKQKLSPLVQQHERETLTDIDMAMRMHHTCRFPIVSDPVPDPFGLSNGDDLHGSLGVHRGRQRLGRHRFSPGCNLGGGN